MFMVGQTVRADIEHLGDDGRMLLQAILKELAHPTPSHEPLPTRPSPRCRPAQHTLFQHHPSLPFPSRACDDMVAVAVAAMVLVHMVVVVVVAEVIVVAVLVDYGVGCGSLVGR